MEVAVLGPVEVRLDGRTVVPGAPKDRALLAALALHPGDMVAVDRLIDALWGEKPPTTAGRTLQSHISRLRGLVGADTILSEPGGYRLDLPGAASDVGLLTELLADAVRERGKGDLAAARHTYARAESLWRGEPLTDLADGPVRWGEHRRLRELWRQARDGRIEADLALGRQSELIAELEQLVSEEPLYERAWAQLMYALYRSGRQAESLRAYRRLRDVLTAELGLEPSPPLQRLEWQILRQDSQLDPDPPLPPVSLPTPVTSFIGRAAEVDETADLIRENRLVTLHGLGGVGKTRLALEAVQRIVRSFPDGVWWVDLIRAAEGSAVVRAISDAVGVPTGVGGTPSTPSSRISAAAGSCSCSTTPSTSPTRWRR